ncbi:MAG: hypothetical protein ABUL64_02960 [Singulisphaera sp.]
MNYEFPADVAQLIDAYLATGAYSDRNEVLRDALRALGEFTHSPEDAVTEFRDTVAAVREGLADVHAGRLTSLRDLIKDAQRRSGEAQP